MNTGVKTQNSKNLTILIQAIVVSRIGSQLSYGVLTLWCAYQYNSGLQAGFLTSLPLLAGVIASIFIGPAVERARPLRSMASSDYANAFFALATGLAISFSAVNPAVGFAIVIFLRIASAIATSVFEPAAQVLLPLIVSDEDLMAANSKVGAAKSATGLIGTSLSGFLYQLLGPTVLFAADGVSYLFSALLLSSIRPASREREVRASDSDARSVRRYFDELKAGYRYVYSEKGLVFLLIAVLSLNFGIQPLGLALAFYTKDVLGLASSWYGFLLGAFTLANLASVLVTDTWKKKLGVSSHTFFVLHIALMGLSQILLFVFPNTICAFLSIALLGLAQGPVNVVVMTAIQRATPSLYQGRVQSLLMAFFGISGPIGMIVAGRLIDTLKGNLGLWFLGAAVACFLTVLLILPSKTLRDYLDENRFV